jgi:2-dehydropantoate 2-reductase
MSVAYSSIAIVGAGAIGTYYGVRLGRAGADVRFLVRSDLAAVRQRGSMLIHERGTTVELRPAAVCASAGEIGPVDLVIVTLKTTANGTLAGLLPPLVRAGTLVLTLQNGLGADELIASIVGADRVLGGLAFIASTRTGPGEVTCYHPGSITLGEFGRPAAERTRQLADQLTAAGVKLRVVDDLVSARWHKLVWNIPFNGLAVAAGGITTDRICADPALAARVRTLMQEVQRGAAGLGCTIKDEFLRQQFEVTPPMGAYQPSSLVDYRAGREVEIEAIWGEPLRRARAAGVELPELARLYDELRAVNPAPPRAQSGR